MKLRHFFIGGVAALALVGPVSVSAQQEDRFASVEITSEALRGNVYVLYGAGGNIGVSAGEDGIFLIDDQFAQLTEKIRAAIAKISDKDIRFVINTHYHGDHTGGNWNFGLAGTVVVAHDNVRQRLSAEAFERSVDGKLSMGQKAGIPVVTFSDEMSFHMNGDEARIIYAANGHTDGDSFIFFKDTNIIHMGDLFFNGTYPYIDLGSGGSVGGMIAAAEKVAGIANEQTIIIPGHGKVTDKAGLQAYKDMLVATRDIIAKLKADGKSLDEIRAMKPLTAFTEAWGSRKGGEDRYIGYIFNSL